MSDYFRDKSLMSNFYFPTVESLVFIRDIQLKLNQTSIQFENPHRFTGILDIATNFSEKIISFMDSFDHGLNFGFGSNHLLFKSPRDLKNNMNTFDDSSWTLAYYMAAIQFILSQINIRHLDFKHIIITGDIESSDAWNAGNVTRIKEKIESICEAFSADSTRFDTNEKTIFIYICDNKEVPEEKIYTFVRNNKTYRYIIKKDSLEIIRNENDIFKIQLYRVPTNADTPRVKLILKKLYGQEFQIENQAYIPNNENVQAANTEQAPNRAYIKGVWAFEENDFEIFKNLGREVEKAKCFDLIKKDIFRIGILTGDSGVGKSSFLKAGLIRYCEENQSKCYYIEVNKENPFLTLRITLREKFSNLGEPNENPIEGLKEIYNTITRDKKVLIIFDQFEQFHLNSNALEKTNFLNALIVLSENNTRYKKLKILLCMRKDLYGIICLDYLQRKEKNNLFFNKGENVYELENFSTTRALEILKILSLNAKLNFEEAALKKFIENDLANAANNYFVSPIDLQVFVFVAELPNSEITPKNLNQIGMEGIYFLYIKFLLKDKDNLETETEKLEFRILTSLIQDEKSKPKSMEELSLEIYNPENIDFHKVLKSLEQKKLIIQNPQSNNYQLVHEKLIQPIQKMTRKLLGKEEKIRELLLGRFEAWKRNKKEKKYLLDLVDYFKIKKVYQSFPNLAGNSVLIERYVEESKKRFIRIASFSLTLASIITLLSVVLPKTELWHNYKRMSMEEKLVKDGLRMSTFPLDSNFYQKADYYSFRYFNFNKREKINDYFVQSFILRKFNQKRGIYEDGFVLALTEALINENNYEKMKKFNSEIIENKYQLKRKSLPLLLINASLLEYIYKTERKDLLLLGEVLEIIQQMPDENNTPILVKDKICAYLYFISIASKLPLAPEKKEELVNNAIRNVFEYRGRIQDLQTKVEILFLMIKIFKSSKSYERGTEQLLIELNSMINKIEDEKRLSYIKRYIDLCLEIKEMRRVHKNMILLKNIAKKKSIFYLLYLVDLQFRVRNEEAAMEGLNEINSKLNQFPQTISMLESTFLDLNKKPNEQQNFKLLAKSIYHISRNSYNLKQSYELFKLITTLSSYPNIHKFFLKYYFIGLYNSSLCMQLKANDFLKIAEKAYSNNDSAFLHTLPYLIKLSHLNGEPKEADKLLLDNIKLFISVDDFKILMTNYNSKDQQVLDKQISQVMKVMFDFQQQSENGKNRALQNRELYLQLGCLGILHKHASDPHLEFQDSNLTISEKLEFYVERRIFNETYQKACIAWRNFTKKDKDRIKLLQEAISNEPFNAQFLYLQSKMYNEKKMPTNAYEFKRKAKLSYFLLYDIDYRHSYFNPYSIEFDVNSGLNWNKDNNYSFFELELDDIIE